ncbi:hypothetical protein GZ77_14930 [Endozoicomonas montiporae]|uniref:Uncharacterized protein n=2 Tax=Endozoicomonas montiporae TaxID=1027273 RepID=A0A081N587_9GAMM|nr:hypothetical protein [Endozoicomonas montiporae]AMO57511.1 hypothetical protein EZMO1_3528 [Endozoicomonas montiporae CL-33]KEQ13610.1 hypothetical protein GZ77_14930 [Endozoicomonas montiporae]
MRQFFSLFQRFQLMLVLLSGLAQASSEYRYVTQPVGMDSLLPVIEISPDGLIPDDGSNCALVDSEGYAHFYLTAPSQLKDDYWDSKYYNPIRPGSTAMDEGFDYTHHGLYLDLAGMNRLGHSTVDSERLDIPRTSLRAIYSPGNEGKRICLFTQHKPGKSPYERVPSVLETLGYHAMMLTVSGGIDKLTGNRLNNFGGINPFAHIHGYTMLFAQLKAGRDLKRFFINHGFSAAGSTCSTMAIQGALAYFKLVDFLTEMKDLTLAGRYATFWLSPLSGNTLDCITQAVIQPVAEYISPANGTVRQPASNLITDAWSAYSGFGAASLLAPTAKNAMLKAMLVKVTISSGGRIRHFIRCLTELERGADAEIYSVFQEGLVYISMSFLGGEGKVTKVLFDEFLKQTSSSFMGYELSSNQRMQEVEEWFQGQINGGLVTLGALAGLQASAIASPYAAKLIAYLASVAQTSVPGYALAAKGANNLFWLTGKAGGLAGGAVKAFPGAERLLSFKLFPELFVAHSLAKGVALHVSLNYVGPTSVLFTKLIADMMTNASVPRAPIRTLVQADQRLTIGHYVDDGSRHRVNFQPYKLPSQ